MAKTCLGPTDTPLQYRKFKIHIVEDLNITQLASQQYFQLQFTTGGEVKNPVSLSFISSTQSHLQFNGFKVRAVKNFEMKNQLIGQYFGKTHTGRRELEKLTSFSFIRLTVFRLQNFRVQAVEDFYMIDHLRKPHFQFSYTGGE